MFQDVLADLTNRDLGRLEEFEYFVKGFLLFDVKRLLVRKVFGKFLVFWFCFEHLTTIASCSSAGNNN